MDWRFSIAPRINPLLATSSEIHASWAREYKIPNIEFVGYFVFTVLELRASQLLGLRRREYGVAKLLRAKRGVS